MLSIRSALMCIALALSALSVALPLAALAQDSPARKELKRVDLDGVPGMEVVSSITEYKPGDSIAAHLHHGIEAGYVVQGAMIQLPGKEPTMLPSGAPVLNLRDVMHGGFTVVGAGSLVLFTVHNVDKGKPLYDVAK